MLFARGWGAGGVRVRIGLLPFWAPWGSTVWMSCGLSDLPYTVNIQSKEP